MGIINSHASLISTTSMSLSNDRLYLASSFGMAKTGPMPMIRGGSPAKAVPMYFARMGCFSSIALDRFISNRAPAPSVIWLALPACVVSPYSAKLGFSLLMPSKVVPQRISSLSTVTSFPSCFTVIGTISSSNQPCFCACSARRYDSTAYSSCRCREI